RSGRRNSGRFAPERRVAVGLQAALLEFLAAAARAGIVATDVFEGIDCLLRIPQRVAGRPRFIILVSPCIERPGRESFDNVAQRRMPLEKPRWPIRGLQCCIQIFLEIFEAQRRGVDPATLERLLDLRLQLDKSQRSNRALPTVPDAATPR